MQDINAETLTIFQEKKLFNRTRLSRAENVILSAKSRAENVIILVKSRAENVIMLV